MSNIEEAERRIQENKQNSDPFLELNNLSLREIPDTTFQLTHLRKLSLTNNALEKLDKRLLELHDLKVLGLNYNKLTILPPWIGEMKFLRSLDCWNNKIRAIPSELGKMEKLEYLTLGFNELQAIPQDLFIFFSRLKALDLQSNPFEDMPAVRDMEIFDLMSYFRNETAHYSFIEVPKELATVCQQFLDFFPEYIQRATGNEITLDVTRTKNGLKLLTYETPEFDIDAINQQFKQYMQSLSPSANNLQTLLPANSVESRLLELQLKLQKQHFTSQLEILQFEKQYLQELVNKFVDIPEIWAKNQTPVYLTVQSPQDKDIEEILRQILEHVSGNSEAVSLYEELAKEVRSKDFDRDRIKKIWNQLCEKAPKVVTFLGSLSKLFGL